jgi:hypothetical protein
MNYKKTIRLLEPHGGWGVHQEFYNKEILNSNYNLILNNDTGLCNRIFNWEAIYYIIDQVNDPDLHIAVQKWIWPELVLLELPDTVSVDYHQLKGNDWYSGDEQSNLYFKTIFDTEKNMVSVSEPINKSFLLDLFKNNSFKKILKNNHWYTDIGYITIKLIGKELYGDKGNKDTIKRYFKNSIRPLDKIHIKDKIIAKKIEETYSSYVGIHIRRGNGIHLTEEVIKNLPNDIRDEYIEYWKKNFKIDCEAYNFIYDEVYFKLIDEILKIKPNQKIYISHDLTDNLIKKYYNRYPKNIVTKKDIRKYYYNYYKKRIPNLDHLIKYANVLDNVLDLFILAKCGFKILYKNSTWSNFANEYRKPNHEKNYFINNIDKLLKNPDKLESIIKNLPEEKII